MFQSTDSHFEAKPTFKYSKSNLEPEAMRNETKEIENLIEFSRISKVEKSSKVFAPKYPMNNCAINP